MPSLPIGSKAIILKQSLYCNLEGRFRFKISQLPCILITTYVGLIQSCLLENNIFLLKIFIYFTYRLVSPTSSHSISPPPIYFPLASTPPHPPLHLCSEGADLPWAQSMAHQAETGPSSSPCIKAKQGNPAWGISSQNENNI